MMSEHVRRTDSDWTDQEAEIVLGGMVDASPDQICTYTAVVVVHNDNGVHELRMVAYPGDTPETVAELLTHTLAHLKGDCESCAAEKARRQHDHS